MASPLPVGPMPGGWNGQTGPTLPMAPEYDQSGLPSRPMGLKVHYTFDKEGRDRCLARHRHTLSIQTIPMDEGMSIGLVDLRACIQAVTDCSPELIGREGDYTIYAVDYSEEDTPLVGQGLLSWTLDSMRGDVSAQQPKMVTGRVTRNLLGVFGGGGRETLEVRLKLAEAAQIYRPDPQRGYELPPNGRSAEIALTPTGSSEWSALMQSNSHFSQHHHGHAQPQPPPQPQPLPQQPQQAQPHFFRASSPAAPHAGQASVRERRDSIGPREFQFVVAPETQKVAPTPADLPLSVPIPHSGSRPSSRASNRSTRSRKPPTGRPRGRPRKTAPGGNTSGYEDGTEGEDGPPAKRRAKVTQVEKAAANPFGSEPDSLRVAASTSGSLRNFRPIGVSGNAATGSHLRDVPRAPTPVPQDPLSGGGLPCLGGKKKPPLLRRQSTMSQEINPSQSTTPPDPQFPLSPGHEDGRSPDSLAPTPNYFEDSPADIGSSPPLPRITSYLQSSPPPSSPILPPMVQVQLPRNAGFPSTDMDDLFGHETRGRGIPPADAVRNGASKATTADSAGQYGRPSRTNDSLEDDEDLMPLPDATVPPPQPKAAPHLTSESHTDHWTQTGAPGMSTKRQPAAKKRALKAPKASSVPTPPPTTDAVEKPRTPDNGRQELQQGAQIQRQFVTEVDTTSRTELKELGAGHDAEAAALYPRASQVVSSLSNVPTAEQGFEFGLQLADARDQQGPLPARLPPSEAAPSTTVQTHHARPIARSQSAGPLVLPLGRTEAALSSALSRVMDAESEPAMDLELPKRSASSGPLVLPVSDDDVVQRDAPSYPVQGTATDIPGESIVPPPSSPQTSKSNKNYVKKHAIKQRLEEAIQRGEMPPFCSNCGAIETPTWRKIWVQDFEGVPEKVDFSEKPGKITAIEILKREEDGKPSAYRVVKKSLSKTEDRKPWQELLLCNPCGIWLAKCKMHRPADRWDKDASRLGQDRRKRASASGGGPRPKKPKIRGDMLANLTSEAYLPTDAHGPLEPSSPKSSDAAAAQVGAHESNRDRAEEAGGSRSHFGPTNQSRSGKTQDGSVLDSGDATNSTRRLLFPSPRKDSSPKVLGELDINIVKTPDEYSRKAETAPEKENVSAEAGQEPVGRDDGIDALFDDPTPARPSTPVPKSRPQEQSGAFKTPTRSTSSHRPITRSVTRSIRSLGGFGSPARLELLQQTPSKTPRSARNALASSAQRQSLQGHDMSFDHVFDTPITRSISQLFAEQHHTLGVADVDLSSLPALDEENAMDWGNVFSTDCLIPSSPGNWVGFDYNGSADIVDKWAEEAGAQLSRGSR